MQALKKGLIEHEASDTGGVPRWKSSCPDRLAEATGHGRRATVDFVVCFGCGGISFSLFNFRCFLRTHTTCCKYEAALPHLPLY